MYRLIILFTFCSWPGKKGTENINLGRNITNNSIMYEPIHSNIMIQRKAKRKRWWWSTLCGGLCTFTEVCSQYLRRLLGMLSKWNRDALCIHFSLCVIYRAAENPTLLYYREMGFIKKYLSNNAFHDLIRVLQPEDPTKIECNSSIYYVHHQKHLFAVLGLCELCHTKCIF